MGLDMNDTKHEEGNGRFDLMTDEEVRFITYETLSSIIARLVHLYKEFGESSVGE